MGMSPSKKEPPGSEGSGGQATRWTNIDVCDYLKLGADAAQML